MAAPEVRQPNNRSMRDVIKTFIENRVSRDKVAIFYSLPMTAFTVSCASFVVIAAALKMAYGIHHQFIMFNCTFILFAGTSTVQLQHGLAEKNNEKLFYWVVLKTIELTLLAKVVFYLLVYSASVKFIIFCLTLMITTGFHMYSLYKTIEIMEPVIPIEETLYDLPPTYKSYKFTTLSDYYDTPY